MKYLKWHYSEILVVDINEMVKNCHDCLASKMVYYLKCAPQTFRSIVVPGCLVSISIPETPHSGGITYSATSFGKINGDIDNKDI